MDQKKRAREAETEEGQRESEGGREREREGRTERERERGRDRYVAHTELIPQVGLLLLVRGRKYYSENSNSKSCWL